jgi:hypothetical protein
MTAERNHNSLHPHREYALQKPLGLGRTCVSGYPDDVRSCCSWLNSGICGVRDVEAAKPTVLYVGHLTDVAMEVTSETDCKSARQMAEQAAGMGRKGNECSERVRRGDVWSDGGEILGVGGEVVWCGAVLPVSRVTRSLVWAFGLPVT